jgi:multiple sugar transport system permease protein
MLTLLVDSLAAYGFSRLEFPCRRLLFILVIASMMVPFPTTLVPTYMMLRKLHWLNTYFALIIPPLAGPFGVFLLKQFFDTIPKDIVEAATIDGCSKFGVYWHVVLPASKSVMATLGIFVFMGTWNAFLWPLIVTHSLKMRLLPVGLVLFNSEYWAERALVMAGAVFCAVPVFIAFLFFQRHIVRGVTLSGLKA